MEKKKNVLARLFNKKVFFVVFVGPTAGYVLIPAVASMTAPMLSTDILVWLGAAPSTWFSFLEGSMFYRVPVSVAGYNLAMKQASWTSFAVSSLCLKGLSKKEAKEEEGFEPKITEVDDLVIVDDPMKVEERDDYCLVSLN